MPLTTNTPALRVGIPDGVDPENVRSRKQALIAAGTSEVIADSIAITAAEQQHLRDAKLKKTAVIKDEVVKASVVKTQTAHVKNLSASKPPKKVPVGKVAPIATTTVVSTDTTAV